MNKVHSKEERFDFVEKYKASRLTMKQFSAKNSLKYCTFAQWRAEHENKTPNIITHFIELGYRNISL